MALKLETRLEIRVQSLNWKEMIKINNGESQILGGEKVWVIIL